MRVGYFIDVAYPYIKGGAEKRIYEIYKRLAEKGFETHIYCAKWWKNKIKSVEIDGIKLHSVCNSFELYNKNGKRRITPSIKYSFSILKNIPNINRLDIVDANIHPYLHLYPLKILSSLRNSSLIITWIEGPWLNYWFKYLGKLGIIGYVFERTLKYIPDIHIAECGKNVELLHKLGVNDEKIKIIPSGVDFKHIRKISPSKDYNFDAIYLGRLIRLKRVDVLINSIKIIKDEIPDIKVGIIGDGPERQYLDKLTKKLQLVENIKFFGRIDDNDYVYSILKSSKIFVLPAGIAGGWGLVLLEACACGLPIVSSRVSDIGTSEGIVQDGYNGFLTNSLSPSELSNKIIKLLKDNNLRDKMSKNSIHFSKNYDWDIIANIYEKVYEEMLNNKKGA